MGNFVPTVFPGGVTNADIDSFGARVPMPWPAQYYTFFDDLDRFVQNAATTPVAFGEWLTTAVGSSTIAVQDAANGVIILTTGATDTNAIYAQWQGGKDAAGTAAVAETFTFVPGKRLWFASRFRLVADVTDEALIVGLAVTDTTPISAVDGVYFQKDDLSTTLRLASSIAGPTAESANLLTMVAATWYEVGYEYNGVDEIKAYLKDTTSGAWNAVGRVGVTGLPTTELAVTIGILSGANGAKTAEIDYIFASKER